MNPIEIIMHEQADTCKEWEIPYTVRINISDRPGIGVGLLWDLIVASPLTLKDLGLDQPFTFRLAPPYNTIHSEAKFITKAAYNYTALDFIRWMQVHERFIDLLIKFQEQD